MQTKLELKFVNHKTALHAVKNWHYSKCLPTGKILKIGVFENDVFIGVILYSLGAGNMTNGKKYGLAKSHEVVELSRVALDKHKTPVSKIISISIKLLRKQSPNIKLIISFADEMSQGHIGSIYQAANFIYTGFFSSNKKFFLVFGKVYHGRTLYAKGWKQSLEWLKKNIDKNSSNIETIKHRYLYPLNDEVRKKVLQFSKPYPKRALSVDSDTAPFQGAKGGANPTKAHQITSPPASQP